MVTRISIEWEEKSGRHTVSAFLPNGKKVSSFGRDEYRIFITLIQRINDNGYFVKISDAALNEIEIVE